MKKIKQLKLHEKSHTPSHDILNVAKYRLLRAIYRSSNPSLSARMVNEKNG